MLVLAHLLVVVLPQLHRCHLLPELQRHLLCAPHSRVGGTALQVCPELRHGVAKVEVNSTAKQRF
jgi:hypothetical protein